MIKLNLGSGIHIKNGFINVDAFYNEDDLKNHTGICKQSIWEKGAKYVQADIRKMPFKDNYADYAELFEVLEHIPFRDVTPTLKEIRRVLKKGGKLLMHVPNFDGLMKDWLELITTDFDMDQTVYVMETIYGNQLADGEFHKTAFNPRIMNYFLNSAGFKKGTMAVIKKGQPTVDIGSDKAKKGQVMRNELLIVEVIK